MDLEKRIEDLEKTVNSLVRYLHTTRKTSRQKVLPLPQSANNDPLAHVTTEELLRVVKNPSHNDK